MSDLKHILKNAGWNFGGNFVPLVAAAVFIPFIIAKVGADRFGFLSLAWVLIGYFSLFDLGLGRALTKMIAERRDTPKAYEIQSLATTGTILISILGVIGGLLIAACAIISFTIFHFFSSEIYSEVRNSTFLIAVGIPFVVTTAAMRGVLEGVQAFRELNVIRAPAGILCFAAPALSSLFSPRLDLAILGLVVTRMFILLAYVRPCLSHVQFRLGLVDFKYAPSMLRFGGWLTLSSIIGPIIVYIDRFVIGAALSFSAITYYSIPFDIVSRILIVPISLATAMFPALISINHLRPDGAKMLQRKTIHLTLIVSLSLCIIGAVVARLGLNFWLGQAFADNSTIVFQLLLPGLIFNSIAQIPLMAMYGRGLSRPVALLHATELVPYIFLLWMLCKIFGIAGAAMAWSIRAAFDWAALTIMLRKTEDNLSSEAY